MLTDYVKVSLLMMRAKPVRSVLSLLGIYIGVLALVVILSIGAGLRKKLKETFGTQGARVVYIHPGFDPISKKVGVITKDDLDRLVESPDVLSVMQRANTEFDVRAAATEPFRAKVLGVDEVFTSLYRVPMIRGRAFIKSEIETKQPVCLIGAETVRKLFPTREPLGAFVEMNGLTFQIIGVVNWTTETGQRASMMDVDVMIPYPWLTSQDKSSISFAEVRVRPYISAAQSVDLVTKILSHGDETREKLYFIRSLEQFLQKSQEMTDKVQFGLLAIAAISLLVGGIGVANVMVTSVTERTREIGVRKALGARRTDILLQFLIESSMLTTCGGVLAVVSGGLIISAVSTMADLPMPLAFPTHSVLACLGLTILIGLLAGVYPASRASHLSPADALRYE